MVKAARWAFCLSSPQDALDMSLKMALSIPLADILAYRWEGGSAFCCCTGSLN